MVLSQTSEHIPTPQQILPWSSARIGKRHNKYFLQHRGRQPTECDRADDMLAVSQQPHYKSFIHKAQNGTNVSFSLHCREPTCRAIEQRPYVRQTPPTATVASGIRCSMVPSTLTTTVTWTTGRRRTPYSRTRNSSINILWY